jgi:hypothetical protein
MLGPAIMTASPADRESPASRPTGPRVRPPLTIAAGRVAVVFTWQADRWGHAVSIDGRPLADSLEDTADGRDGTWPASPPLVELSTVETPAGPAILAVGLAGRSHYSASISPHPVEPDTLLVEIACRIKEPPTWLGSTYAVAGEPLRIAGPTAAEPLPTTLRWSYVVGPAGIRPVPPAAVARGD